MRGRVEGNKGEGDQERGEVVLQWKQLGKIQGDRLKALQGLL